MEVIKNRVYKHFKGDYYLVLDIVTDSETGEDMVLYQGLYGEGVKYVRPKKMFEAKISREKYPNVLQEYRFELQELKSKRKED